MSQSTSQRFEASERIQFIKAALTGAAMGLMLWGGAAALQGAWADDGPEGEYGFECNQINPGGGGGGKDPPTDPHFAE